MAICPGGSGTTYMPYPSQCSGSGSGGDPCCGAQLAAFPDLTVTIPDGVNTGTPTAAWNSDGFWNAALAGGDKIRMACVGGVMKAWLASDPGTTVSASAYDCDPLLFTFPGALFGSTGAVTVEL